MDEQEKPWYEVVCDCLEVDLDEMIEKALNNDYKAWFFLHDLFFPHSHEVLSSSWDEPQINFTAFLEELRSSR